MATQMQPASSKNSIPGIIYALMILVFGSTIFLAFCGPTAERAIKQLDEISACRADTDACNAPPEPAGVPTFTDVQVNPDGTPDGTCKARYPDAEGNLPPDAAFDANYTAPSHCVYVQDPGGEVWSAYAYNQDPSRKSRDSGGGLNWGGAIRVFLILAVLIFAWFFWGKWRRAKRRRKELGTMATQPIDPATGGPKMPVPVPVPGAPQDDDFLDDDDEDLD